MTARIPGARCCREHDGSHALVTSHGGIKCESCRASYTEAEAAVLVDPAALAQDTRLAARGCK